MDQQVEEMKLQALEGRIADDINTIKGRTGYQHHIVGHIIGFFCLVLVVGIVTFALAHEPTLQGIASNFFFPHQVSAPPPN